MDLQARNIQLAKAKQPRIETSKQDKKNYIGTTDYKTPIFDEYLDLHAVL